MTQSPRDYQSTNPYSSCRNYVLCVHVPTCMTCLVEGVAEEAGGGGAWNMGVPVTGFLNTGDCRHRAESCAEHDRHSGIL